MRPLRFLDQLSDEKPRERIPGLLTMNGNVLISAYRKTGKTTLILSLLNALTTGEEFLGRRCTALKGPLVYVNLELHENMLREYALRTGMELHNHQAMFQDYRGYGSQFALRDDVWREEYANALADVGAKGLIIDPIHPIMIYASADSNATDDARYVMELLGEIAAVAELDHLFVVDHTGHHDKTRARNSSGKEDWADILWNVTGENEQPRTLTATGRGVSGTMQYTINDGKLVGVSEADEDAMSVKNRVRTVLAKASRALKTREIADLAKCGTTQATDMLNELEDEGNAESRRNRDQGGGFVWIIPGGHW